MRFFDPTNTYAEKNCVKNHKKELLALGSRAFVITGHSSSKKNGSLDDVIAVLEEASVPYQIFNEIEVDKKFKKIYDKTLTNLSVGAFARNRAAKTVKKVSF